MGDVSAEGGGHLFLCGYDGWTGVVGFGALINIDPVTTLGSCFQWFSSQLSNGNHKCAVM